MTITGYNDFYDGWLAWLLAQPYDTNQNWPWQEGWRMADETGESAALALKPEIQKGHIVVAK